MGSVAKVVAEEGSTRVGGNALRRLLKFTEECCCAATALDEGVEGEAHKRGVRAGRRRVGTTGCHAGLVPRNASNQACGWLE